MSELVSLVAAAWVDPISLREKIILLSTARS